MSYVSYNDYCDISVLVGKTVTHIKHGDAEVEFTLDNGDKYVMFHSQDCCESVYLEDVNGDWNDLIGSPITTAEVRTQNENPPGVTVDEYQDCFLWTFYHLATAKGTVVLRWYGDSNGYYSVEVDFGKVTQ